MLVLATIGALVWFVGFSSVLTLRQVNTVGVPDASTQDVIAVASVPVGLPLARVDVGAIEERVASLPPVADVSVSRSWPRSLTIAVVPRVPVATVSSPEGITFIDESGTVFDESFSDTGRVPELRVATTDVARPMREESMRVLASLPPWLWRQVAAVEAVSASDVVLVLRDGRAVRWGSSGQNHFKAEVTKVLLEQPASRYDVSVPDRPAIRP